MWFELWKRARIQAIIYILGSSGGAILKKYYTKQKSMARSEKMLSDRHLNSVSVIKLALIYFHNLFTI